MEKVSLAEQKEVMLKILLYIDQIVSENNLRYSLWGGTMLGAVRHKGFIPWDDDIDISLPRDDYEKLINILKNENKYKLYEYRLQGDYTWSWAKLTDRSTIDNKKKYFKQESTHGIFVDIIPIDGLPSEDSDIRQFKKELYRLNLLIKSTQFPSCASSINLKTSLKKYLLLFPISVYSNVKGGKMKLIDDLETLSKTYPLEKATKCGHLLSRYKSSLGYPSSIWDKLKEYEFEGYYFKGISDSYSYLSTLYGNDFMEIPPKEKRVTHEEHDFYRMDGVRDEHSYDNGQWQGSENGAEYS